MNRKHLLFSICIILVTALIAYIGYGRLTSPKADFLPNTNMADTVKYLKIVPPVFPKAMDFCGEPVPLQVREIKERLDRELLINMYYHGSNLYNLKLTTRWFPVIEPILKQKGIPDDFKYLCLAESALQQVTSKSNAVGFWQFLGETGKKYGLEINDEVDERYHVERATEAACDYFLKAYSMFGNWTVVAASYNCGTTGMQNFINDQQQQDYYDLLLPDETMRYVFRILALKEIFTHPTRYGFQLSPGDFYPPYQYSTASIDTTISSLTDFALQHGTTYKTLKILNPWLRNKQLRNASKKHYEIKLPT